MSSNETSLVASSRIRIPFLTESWNTTLFVSSVESSTSLWRQRPLSNNWLKLSSWFSSITDLIKYKSKSVIKNVLQRIKKSVNVIWLILNFVIPCLQSLYLFLCGVGLCCRFKVWFGEYRQTRSCKVNQNRKQNLNYLLVTIIVVQLAEQNCHFIYSLSSSEIFLYFLHSENVLSSYQLYNIEHLTGYLCQSNHLRFRILHLKWTVTISWIWKLLACCRGIPSDATRSLSLRLPSSYWGSPPLEESGKIK